MEECDHAIVAAFLRTTSAQKDSTPTVTSSIISIFHKSPSYYVLGDWATCIAENVMKSTTVLKKWSIPSNPNLVALVLNETTYRAAAREMILSNGVLINVYEKQSNSDIYALKAKITPGNIAFHEELICEGHISASGVGDSSAQISQLVCASVAAVILTKDADKVIVYMAVSNANQRLISVSSFHDTNDLISLCAIVAQLSVRELFLPITQGNDNTVGSRTSGGGADTHLDNATMEKISQLCKRDNILLTYLSRISFSEKNVDARLGELLRVAGDRLLLTSLPKDTLRALGALLGEVQIPVSATKTYQLMEIAPKTIMRLDAMALNTLHIVSAASEPRRGKLPISIFGWLNQYTASSMGSRLMRQWLLQPSTDIDTIVGRQLVLESILDCPIVRDSLHSEVLKTCPDMDRLCRRIQCRSATVRELFMLIVFVTCVKRCVGILQLSPEGYNRKLIMDDFIIPLEEMSTLMGNLVTLLEATVDVTDDNEYRIKPEFDDELEECAAQQDQIRKKIDDEFSKVCRSNGWAKDKVCKCELHASYGFVFRVSRKEDNAVRSSSKLTVIQTSKDGVRFTSDTLADLSQQYKEFTRVYEVRQGALHNKLMETVETYLPVVDDAKELLARLDVFISWANVIGSSRLQFCRPDILPMDGSSHTDTTSHNADNGLGGEDDAFVVTDLWHPLVEVRTGAFIPNNLKLSNSRNSTAIITGPNMGGKSTLMRSVGVATVLAQAGCFVPCKSARIKIRDAIMCRIGATDYMSQGVSTFMVEMLETSAILSAASRNTLVIIDELGRGTSTYDGFGLAWAVAHHLSLEVKCTVLFSTHFHELTELAYSTDGCRVFNLHFGADTLSNGTLQFGYKLLPGACTKSFGIEVAEMAGLPASLIEDAKVSAAELEDFFGSGNSDNNEAAKLNQFISTMTPVVEQQLIALATEASSIDPCDLEAVAAFKNKVMESEGGTLIARQVRK